MKYKAHIILSVTISGFFLLLDQILKFIARTNPHSTYYIWKPWIGWEYFENKGIAFSIPLPQPVIILLTPIIILFIMYWWSKKKYKAAIHYLATTLIIAGALSNFIDRILFSITIDYLRIATSVINIGDILIVIGAIMFILGERKKEKAV
ncbi:MAG TPA: hypothetical protein DCS29_04665 [Candidatus Magasanikbacteria bacterium]|nr:MAG: hypothetical protein A2479_04010 [Candidatus Magasanikbacteria bacterium RIFOXYC2_FULL_39_8]HAT04032.1 hypothetical protein [Candidatus Magasanikbacteria bacterium]